MALLYVDSFDHYDTAALAYKGWTAGGSGAVISSGNGRNSTDSLRLVSGSNGQCYVNRTLSPSGTTCILGFGYRRTGTFSASVPLVAIMDGSVPQVIIVETSSGTLAAYRSNGSQTTVTPASGTLLGASAAVIAGSTYYFIEIKVVIHNSTGTVDIKVDGSSVLSLSGQDTQATSNTQWAGLRFGNDYAMGAFSATREYDDLHIADGSGGSNNDFLGDHRIVAKVASSGNGTNTDWSPSTGSDHGALVDENPPNTSDYNQSGTAGQRDTYNFAAVGVSGTVKAVQTVNLLKADVAGVRYVGDSIRISSSNYDSSGTVVGSDWVYRCELHPTSPATATAWTTSEIDGAEFGVKVTA